MRGPKATSSFNSEFARPASVAAVSCQNKHPGERFRCIWRSSSSSSSRAKATATGSIFWAPNQRHTCMFYTTQALCATFEPRMHLGRRTGVPDTTMDELRP